jgi:cell division protein FtsW (lipid II flippase)
MASKLRTVSWILLVVAAGLTILGSLVSASVALRGTGEAIGPISLEELSAGREGVSTALRARRLTAAAYAAGFGVLLLSIAVAPYRRGEAWAWWAVLAGVLTLVLLALARVPVLGTRTGAGAPVIMLAVVGLALLLDVGRLRRAAGP